MWSHTNLNGDMQTITPMLQRILSLILHITHGEDDPIVTSYPSDVGCFAVARETYLCSHLARLIT